MFQMIWDHWTIHKICLEAGSYWLQCVYLLSVENCIQIFICESKICSVLDLESKIPAHLALNLHSVLHIYSIYDELVAS